MKNGSRALKIFGFSNWEMLLFGFQKGWISKKDVEAHAIDILSSSKDINETVLQLADADALSAAEIRELLLNLSDSAVANSVVSEKWKLVKLSELAKSPVSDQEKLDQLQELYGDFDYPEDMRPCSIYSQDTKDPLAAMDDLIALLEKKYLHKQNKP